MHPAIYWHAMVCIMSGFRGGDHVYVGCKLFTGR